MISINQEIQIILVLKIQQKNANNPPRQTAQEEADAIWADIQVNKASPSSSPPGSEPIETTHLSPDITETQDLVHYQVNFSFTHSGKTKVIENFKQSHGSKWESDYGVQTTATEAVLIITGTQKQIDRLLKYEPLGGTRAIEPFKNGSEQTPTKSKKLPIPIRSIAGH